MLQNSLTMLDQGDWSIANLKFLSDMDSENGDVLYCTEVCWLSQGQMLKCVCNLKLEINVFLHMKRVFHSLLIMTGCAILHSALSQYLNELNRNH
jgi:hypothetical protein